MSQQLLAVQRQVEPITHEMTCGHEGRVTFLPGQLKYLSNKAVDQMAWNFNHFSLTTTTHRDLTKVTVVPNVDSKTPVSVRGNPSGARTGLVINLIKLLE